MRWIVRTAVVVTVCVLVAAPASAGQWITYRGTTSAPRFHRVDASALKRDSGRRFLKMFRVLMTVTCEDGTEQRVGVSFGSDQHLDASGAFDLGPVQFPGPYSIYLFIQGNLRWARGSGTTVLNFATLTADGQDSQFCSTSDLATGDPLTWTVDRTKAVPTMPTARSGDGVLKVREEDGEYSLVKWVAPTSS